MFTSVSLEIDWHFLKNKMTFGQKDKLFIQKDT